MDIITLIVTLILGICVLLTYYIIFAKKMPGPGGYQNHPAWIGIHTSTIKILIAFQVLAAIGFIVAIWTWIVNPPQGGIAGGGRLPWLVALFILSAIIWPVALYYKIHWLVVLSLITTAIGTILLLAGSVEEDNSRWWVVLGFLMLNVVTVLGDGVMWNSVYIKALQNGTLDLKSR